ncbi:MFS transporter [Bacillus pseudomycoides]|uniref:MFS transporter n=1 Tax=Bacillus pseudomycoides TaxID=64104 RepID=UPI001FB4A4F4|nr:MFS transporter [Bacillus pseudomycoides]
MNLKFKFKLYTIFEPWKSEKEIVAENEKEARFKYYRTFTSQRGYFEMKFQEFMKFVKCESLGLADVTQLYGKERNFRRMCERRKITFAYLGMRVQILGRMGTIIGNRKTNLLVLFDGDTHAYNCDPRFEIAYFNKEGCIIKDTRKGVYAV